MRVIILETFLGGMETCGGGAWRGSLRFLETFLGGMETRLRIEADQVGVSALKPSLVEWKLEQYGVGERPLLRLETFLSGMETQKGLGSLHEIDRP